jgi:hypothetical protein
MKRFLERWLAVAKEGATGIGKGAKACPGRAAQQMSVSYVQEKSSQVISSLVDLDMKEIFSVGERVNELGFVVC